MNYLAIKDEAVKQRTGKDWKQWFKLLNRTYNKLGGHKETAKHLAKKYKINGWWAQVVTIRYEKQKKIKS